MVTVRPLNMTFGPFILAGAIFATLAPSPAALALPEFEKDTGSNDRITADLFTNDRNINGDVESYCEVRISGSGEFRQGEEITVKVWFNDVLSFQTSGTVTAAEGESDTLFRNYDCSGAFGTATSHEIRADVKVEDNCYTICFHDEVKDLTVTSSGVTDDSISNTGYNDAYELEVSGLFDDYPEFISRTKDYFSITIEEDSDVWVNIYSFASEGELDVSVYKDAGAQPELLEQKDVYSFNTWLQYDSWDPGTYFVTVEPLFAQNYNFFEIGYQAYATGQACNTDDEEIRMCGNCGSQVRVCNDEGQWSAWAPCDVPEGNCEPGATQEIPCDDGFSSQQELCSISCSWMITQDCPLFSNDGGNGTFDGGGPYATDLDAGEEPMTWDVDAGAEATEPPNDETDGGTSAAGGPEQPEGEITAGGGCACNHNQLPTDGKIPLVLLLAFWWLSVRYRQERHISYYGRNFQGRWVPKRD